VEGRWSTDQVSALAADAASVAAARRLAVPAPWSDTGASADPAAVWGQCRGSGAVPYQTVVDLSGPAFRCSCPSRKFPCKHALGLLFLWSSGQVPHAEEPPEFAGSWLATREQQAARAGARWEARDQARGPVRPANPEAALKRARQRAERVASGLAELDQWLRDQVRTGLAGTDRAAYRHFEAVAARLVDAQSPAVASRLRGLPAVVASGEGWPARLLAEYGLLRLLVVAHRRLAELPEPVAATVRIRIGYPLSRQEVLDTPPVRDRWAVLGLRDSAEDRLTVRRVWLHGSATGQAALVLSFAPAGQPLDTSLVPGLTIDADLHFYPGAAPLRALVGTRHGDPVPLEPPAGQPIEQALDGWAAALAADPWLDGWPVVLAGLVPVPQDQGWRVVDGAGRWLPVAAGEADLWRWLAVSGGDPVPVFGEWTPTGLRPVSVLPPAGLVAL
jgi:hypothetical protein